MEILAKFAEGFIALFEVGAETFVGILVGVVPIMLVLMTAFNIIIRLIGPEKIDNLSKKAGGSGIINYPLRYMILPTLSVFFLGNPMALGTGKFLPEKYKPAFNDTIATMVHPPLGLFPHVNPGEFFVWGGIAAGVTALGLPLGGLAIRYLLVGMLIALIRGIVSEWISGIMFARREKVENL
ncbi:MAG: PTS sorbitol transporter subunit IIC [Chloroflexi bacterium]|nr:PTS sorbitol transporter subunit IIC [Chloroflexota bacterium]